MPSLVAQVTAAAALAHGTTAWPPIGLYPPDALAGHRQGVVSVRISGATGSCLVRSGSTHPELDAAACSLMTRHIAAVRRDPGGTVDVKIRWFIPSGQPHIDFDGAIPLGSQSWVRPGDIPIADYPSRGTGRSEIGFDIATDGSVEACRVGASNGSPDLDRRLCRLISERAAFLPAIDDTGAARVAHAVTAITWFTRP